MQKVLDILENYVEWIGLALAAGFLGWMSWLYILNEPVSKTMGTQVVTVADVDQTIADDFAQKVKDKMDAAKGQIPKFTVDNFSVAITKGLNLDGVQTPQLANAFDVEPVKLPESGTGNNTPQENQVVALPPLPAAQPILVYAGKSVILRTTTTAPSPDTGAATAPAAADQTAAAPAAPAAPAAATPAAGAPGAPAAPTVRADMHWTTVAFRIPMSQMASEWAKSFGPDKPGGAWKVAPMTEFLSATLYRSEKMGDGDNWSDETPVPRVWNNVLQTYPLAQNRQMQLGYQQYATHQTADIVAPKFPDLAAEPAGTVWKDPLAILQSVISPPPPAAAPPPPPARPGATAAPVVQVFPPESLDPIVAAVPKADLPTATPVIPSGSFNPAAEVGSTAGAAPGQTDLLIYLHDDTVQPGHTYRYRLVYKLLNPLFDHAPQKAANPAWVDQFDLVSPQSAYSPEIAVPPTTYFYCAEARPSPQQIVGNRPAFTFEVFTWSDGIWKKKTVNASPGDYIGSKEGATDFDTGYTYADGRRRNERFVVTLVDTDGATIIRDAERDMDSQDYKIKTQWAATPATPGVPGAAGAAPTAGGTVTPPEE